MNIAITGGTGFVGRHLALRLLQNNHKVNVIARGNLPACLENRENLNFCKLQYEDQKALEKAISGCEAVFHLAGINREVNPGDFKRAHVEATEKLIKAACLNSVRKLVLVSFLKARANINSQYHQSKWQAEVLVRNSGLDYTILKPGMIYGKGDHMLSHIRKALKISPLFSPVGIFHKNVSPISIKDMIDILEACLLDKRLSEKTFAVTGPESMPLPEVVRRVARATNRLSISIPLPVLFHYCLASLCEALTDNPLVTVAQIKMLGESMDKPLENEEQLPHDLQPKVYLTEDYIQTAY